MDMRHLNASADDHGTEGASLTSWLHALREADAQRAPLPGEHAVVLGVGALLLLSSVRSRSFIPRVAKAALGGALVARAASGTGGVARWAGTLAQLAQRYGAR